MRALRFFGQYSVNSPKIRISPRSPTPAPNPVPGDAQPNNNVKRSNNGAGTTFYGTISDLRR